MDYATLRSRIQVEPACAPHIVTNDMPKDPDYLAKDQAIADILNAPAGTRIAEHWVTAIGLMHELGAITAATILEKLEAASATQPVLKWVMTALNSTKGINVGEQETFTMLDMFSGTILTADEVAQIKAPAQQVSSIAWDTVGRPVTAADVSIALRNF